MFPFSVIPVPTMDEKDQLPDELLLCCKGKRCPTISPVSGGGLELRDQVEGRGHEDVITLDADQASLLLKYLQQKGF